MVRLFLIGLSDKKAANLHDRPNIRPGNRPMSSLKRSRPGSLLIYRSGARVFWDPTSRRRKDSRTDGATEEATTRQPWLATPTSPPTPEGLGSQDAVVSSCSVCACVSWPWILPVAIPSYFFGVWFWCQLEMESSFVSEAFGAAPVM